MSEVSTSRRAVMRALAFLPAVIVAPPAAHAAVELVCSPATGTSPAWNAALARWEKAEAAAATFYRATYAPAFSAWRERTKEQEADLERRTAALPHYVTKAQTGMPRNRFSLSTAEPWYVGLAEEFTRRVATGADMSMEDPDFTKCCLELWPAAQEREAKIASMRAAFVPAEFDEALEEEYGRLDEAEVAAYGEIVVFKARTLADLITKITFLEDRGHPVDHKTLLADLRRISAGEAA